MYDEFIIFYDYHKQEDLLSVLIFQFFIHTFPSCTIAQMVKHTTSDVGGLSEAKKVIFKNKYIRQSYQQGLFFPACDLQICFIWFRRK